MTLREKTGCQQTSSTGVVPQRAVSLLLENPRGKRQNADQTSRGRSLTVHVRYKANNHCLLFYPFLKMQWLLCSAFVLSLWRQLINPSSRNVPSVKSLKTKLSQTSFSLTVHEFSTGICLFIYLLFIYSFIFLSIFSYYLCISSFRLFFIVIDSFAQALVPTYLLYLNST